MVAMSCVVVETERLLLRRWNDEDAASSFPALLGTRLRFRGGKAIIAHAFSRLNISRIVAVAFPENVRSIAAMRSVGMAPVGLAHHFGAMLVKYEAKRSGAAGNKNTRSRRTK